MFVLSLHEVGAGNSDAVGGKGANLGEMVRAGLPVPPGFCVTVEAYRQFMGQNTLWQEVEARVGGTAAGDVLALESAAAEVRAALEGAPIPVEIAAEIVQAYGALGSPPVAVRSSATAEDLPEASFAGQQESYLNVRGDEALLDHVRRCWASLWTARAIAYRDRNGFVHTQVGLAVVVQIMVEADTAGVLFTAHPLSGSRDEILINAAYGLGESIVAGRVIPDTYRLAKTSPATVIEQRVGTKEVQVRPNLDGGTLTASVPDAQRSRPCLDRRELEGLAVLGMACDAHFGVPQDIEWAIAGGNLYLLQARPITTLNAVPLPAANPRRLSTLERRIFDDVLEHYPDPPYPLDYEVVTSGYETLQDMLREAGLALPPATAVIRMDDDGIASITPVSPRPTWRLATFPLHLRQALRYDPNDWPSRAASFAAAEADLSRVNLAHVDGPDLAAHLRRAVAQANEIGRVRFSRYIAPMMMRGALLRVLLRLGGGGREIGEYDLLGGLSYKTAEIDLALATLAETATAAPAVRAALMDLPPSESLTALAATSDGQAFLDEFHDFLGRYGARATKAYLAFSTVSWAEAPELVVTAVATMLRSRSLGSVEERAAAGRQRFEEIKGRVAERLPGPLRRFFTNTLDRFRAGHVAREDSLFATERVLALARAAAHEAGRRLVKAGALATPEQVVFLTLTELSQSLAGRVEPTAIRERIVRRERARTAALAAWRGPAYGARAGEVGDLVGEPGSPGMAQGPAKIILGPEAFGLMQPGDVLVCPFTDPTWTPLFSLASAVVSDTGGALSHAAIVAREYRIPAVLGTHVATSRLKDGQMVTVDGSHGTVQIGPVSRDATPHDEQHMGSVP